jgi:hypothetical protein
MAKYTEISFGLDRHEAIEASASFEEPRRYSFGDGAAHLVLELGKSAQITITGPYSDRPVFERIVQAIGEAYDVADRAEDAPPAITDAMIDAACEAYCSSPACEEDGPLVAEMLAEQRQDMRRALEAALRAAEQGKREAA